MKTLVWISLILTTLSFGEEFHIPNSPDGGYAYASQIIGDYDGDGVDDIAVGKIQGSIPNEMYVYGIYSYNKKKYLISGSSAYPLLGPFKYLSYRDLDNDGAVEIVTNGIVYKYSGGDVNTSKK